MKIRRLGWLSVWLCCVLSLSTTLSAEAPFRRGDANADGAVDISDGVSTLAYLFLGGAAPKCDDAADTDDNGALEITDAVFTFSFLFTGGTQIPLPGPTGCGVDPTSDTLACGVYQPADASLRCADGPPEFSVSIPPHHIATGGIVFDPAAGDLDLTVYTSDGDCVAGRVSLECAWTDRLYETGEEFLSVVNAAHGGFPTYLWKVRAPQGVEPQFTPSLELIPYLEGRTCTDFFPADDCEGRPNGTMKLIQFPLPDALDEWVEDAYFFQSPANYRWARRELIMLVRNALHFTRVQFPGTKPLGIGDICQRDGTTPGFDIGQPRHSESTHDQGASIDLAYYTTLAENGTLDSNPLRIICDANGGSNDGAFCAASATQTHVVDLPRQAYFMAMLLGSPRVRVIGVDRMIAPLLQAEALRQKDLGWITSTATQAFQTKVASGDGWPFHHHNIHVAMQWWSP